MFAPCASPTHAQSDACPARRDASSADSSSASRTTPPARSAKGLNYFFNDELQFGARQFASGTRTSRREFRRRKGYDLLRSPARALRGHRRPHAQGPPGLRGRADAPHGGALLQAHLRLARVAGPDLRLRLGRPRPQPDEFGDYFRAMRWYTAPGHDTPGGQADLIKGKVSSSIANLYRRPRVWLEGYHSLAGAPPRSGSCQATCENYLYGCTLLNLHGLYYTTHGILLGMGAAVLPLPHALLGPHGRLPQVLRAAFLPAQPGRSSATWRCSTRSPRSRRVSTAARPPGRLRHGPRADGGRDQLRVHRRRFPGPRPVAKAGLKSPTPPIAP